MDMPYESIWNAPFLIDFVHPTYEHWRTYDSYLIVAGKKWKMIGRCLWTSDSSRFALWCLAGSMPQRHPTSTPELLQRNIQELWKPGNVSFMYIKSSNIINMILESYYHHTWCEPCPILLLNCLRSEGHYGAHPYDAAARRAATTTVWSWEFLGQSSHLLRISPKMAVVTPNLWHFNGENSGKLGI